LEKKEAVRFERGQSKHTEKPNAHRPMAFNATHKNSHSRTRATKPEKRRNNGRSNGVKRRRLNEGGVHLIRWGI